MVKKISKEHRFNGIIIWVFSFILFVAAFLPMVFSMP